METFTKPKEFVDNSGFREQRHESLARLDLTTIDLPIVGIIEGFSKLEYCFTLQSCYGHFLHRFQKDPDNTEPLPALEDRDTLECRIAYIALCIANNEQGNVLYLELSGIPVLDPEFVQFGSDDWFWCRQPNSYVLQVEPRRHMMKDRAIVDYQEGLRIERVRNRFFAKLDGLLQKHLKRESGRKKPCC